MNIDIKKPADMAWAYRLRERYLRGERLMPIQINLASGALDEVWSNGKCERAAA